MTLDTLRPLPALIAAVLFLTSSPIALAQHGENEHQMDTSTQPEEQVGDPYPLDIDPVTMETLPGLDQQLIIDHEGRELRFGSEDSVEAFGKDPGVYQAVADELIIKQQLPYYPLETCIISGDKLGGDMGDAVNFVYKNRLVRFCCPGCVGEFKDNATANLNKLDEAVKQQQMAEYPLRTCPVSGGKLGAMGDPIDVVIANRLVRLCCDGCIDKLRADPVKYLSELEWDKDEQEDGHNNDGEHHSDSSGDNHAEHNSTAESGARGHSDHGHQNH